MSINASQMSVVTVHMSTYRTLLTVVIRQMQEYTGKLIFICTTDNLRRSAICMNITQEYKTN